MNVFALVGLILISPVLSLAQEEPAGKPVIETQADLPRYTYDLPTETASALLTDDAAFDKVADQVRSDVEALLDRYTIRDKATLRALYGTLQNLALLRGDYDAALKYAERVRSLQEKPAERLTSGIVSESIVAAERSGDDEAVRREVLRETYAARVDTLPWDVVQDNVESAKGMLEIASRNFYTGLIRSQFDPAASETGKISGDVAQSIIGAREFLDVVLPYKDVLVDVLSKYIEANRVEKSDIWADRDTALADSDRLHPVVIGIWDSGVDAAVYGAKMFTNPQESADGRDDDGNGFTDDVHGIAWKLWGGDPTPEMLYPLSEEERERLPQVKDQVKGLLDIQASIDSPEAQALKKKMADMQPQEVQPFIEELGRFANFAHGTHVAGIASAGNPAARILVVRETFPYQMIPPPLTKEDAERWADKMQRTVNYLDQHGARVVNMSWGLAAKDIEQMLEVNGIGADSDERKRMAAETFDVLMTGMRRAMESAPNILFVPAAGNSDEDVGFIVDMPAEIQLPNVLTVGAVDQAGDETSFTSYGENVRAHANGFEVESYLPGGDKMKFSGTSMAAPNVTNLAAKLLALDPSLSSEDVVELILRGADTSEDGRRVLINPKRSIHLLSKGRAPR